MLDKDKSICKEANFHELFKQHSRTIRNYIYYKCGDNDLANDMVQEAFIKLWENCKKVKSDYALFFLKRVANNTFLNTIKHNKVVLEHQKTVKDNRDIENPEFLLEEKEFAVKVQEAIASLPEKDREVFLLNRIDKKKYAEIAEFLEISIKTVEKRMHNALKIIRKEIGNV